MTAGYRFGLIFLLLCRCSLEPQSFAPDDASFVDASGLIDASNSADMSKGADMSVPPKPAQRIVTKKWYAEDGSLFDVPYTFFDTKLGVPCVFLRDPNGITRCLPQDPQDSGITIAFSDSSCTRPIAALTTPPCAPRTYRYILRAVTAPTCGAQPSYTPYVVGPDITTSVMVWSGTPGSCRAGSTGLAFYALTPAPLTDFVAAELK